MAGRYQLTGWVKNLPDGTVEMVAQGDSNDIDSCINDILKYFPDNIETKVTEIPFNPQYNDFKITF
jgi:acylphosphatase